ncbi:MAG: Fe-S cluster assembly protein SufD [Paracoccaceae bacterium]|nr:Fe-S cluster assembly protein SufD [Paracoccaceae bacterium]
MPVQKSGNGGLDAILAAVDPKEGTGWHGLARRDALNRLRTMGLPVPRDEYWRFSGPGPLIWPIEGTSPETTRPPVDCTMPLHASAAVRSVFQETDCLRMVFIDGVFSPDRSDDLVMANVDIVPLSEAMALDIHWSRDLFGKLEADGQSPIARPLAALNTAVARNGFVMDVHGQVPKPVCMVYLRETDQSEAIIHSLVKIRKGASVTLLENGPGAARLNSVLEIDVEQNARFDHVRVQGRDHDRVAATHQFVRLARESSFRSFSMTVNGVHTRNETYIALRGDEAKATVAGVCVGDGEFLHDDTVFVLHDAERCESRQVFKKVLGNGSKGVFQGKILVRPGAQKTDGYQISKGLLLDGTSQFLAKPELEIYADDVACSHGSTCGALDEDSLFYLMARGITRSEAQRMLVLAFLEEAIDEIEDLEIAADLRDRLAEWIARHSS